MSREHSYQTEQQNAKADVASLRDNPKGKEHDHALAEIQAHAAKFGVSGVREEKAYWDAFKNAAAQDHLKPVTFGSVREGHQTSVKVGEDEVYSRDKVVREQKETGTVKLAAHEGPYHAFRRSGMSNKEAQEASKHLLKATGRSSFNQGEQFSIHNDGSVSTKIEGKNTSIQTTYAAHGGMTKTVETNKDGSTKETSYDQDKPTKTILTIPATTDKPSTKIETTLGPDGKPTKSVEIQGDPNGAHKEITKDLTGYPTTTTKEVRVDKSTVTSTVRSDGTTSTMSRDANNALTGTRESTKDKYVDTTYDPKTGKATLIRNHENGQNGAYQESLSYKDGSNYDRLDSYSVGEHKPGQPFNTQQDFYFNGRLSFHRDVTYDGQGKNGTGQEVKLEAHPPNRSKPIKDATWSAAF